jgi:precorrin-3B methylase
VAEKPETILCITVFSHDLTFIGDGTQQKFTVDSKQLLNDYNFLVNCGKDFKVLKKISETKEILTSKVMDQYKLGSATALGPAALFSIGVAMNYPPGS